MVTVILPYAGDCPHRARALGWVMGQYAERHPDWPVFVASGEADPWVKAKAVMPAVEAAEDGLVVVADADVWCDGIHDAVAAVQCERVRWSVPHLDVHRLTGDATARVLDGANLDGAETAEPPYRGLLGGGFVIARRDTLLEAPVDSRFAGWGGEDESWGDALTSLAGRPWRGTAPLFHLWHPPQERRTRRVGSRDNADLRRRYRAARRSPRLMRALVAEAQS